EMSDTTPAWKSTVLLVNGCPMGFKTDACATPVFGWVRRGDGKEYTTKSTWPKSCLIKSIACCCTSSENPSPLVLFAYSAAACASVSKAPELYHPAVHGFPGAAGVSKNTPIVAAPEPKAAVMREARPKPV